MIPDPFFSVLIGLLVGALVGLTGLGGGVVLLPLLIMGLKVPPLFAVGSGAVFSSLTKIGGAVSHWRQGNIDLKLAGLMVVGSVPGALMGVLFLSQLRSQYGDGIDELLTRFIGVLLIVIPVLMMAQEYTFGPRGESTETKSLASAKASLGAIFTGLVGGVLVGMTSVGSGSVIMMLLILFYRRAPRVLVGTDIFHAVILTGVAGLGHMKLGTVNYPLVGWLLVGSIPGVLLGSRLTGSVAPVRLRQVLLGILVITGIVML
jgi:uncharacterized membrane protein YfcA